MGLGVRMEACGGVGVWGACRVAEVCVWGEEAREGKGAASATEANRAVVLNLRIEKVKAAIVRDLLLGMGRQRFAECIFWASAKLVTVAAAFTTRRVASSRKGLVPRARIAPSLTRTLKGVTQLAGEVPGIGRKRALTPARRADRRCTALDVQAESMRTGTSTDSTGEDREGSTRSSSLG